MLRAVLAHPWDLTPKEAVQLQRDLADRVCQADQVTLPPHYVGGVDVGLKGDLARAAVVVLSFPELALVEKQVAEATVTFPYIPGLLSFREAPVVLQALEQVQTIPDVLIFDGQGYAHPRRMGIATHLGVILDWPTIGCAKSRLCGTHEPPGSLCGSHALLYDHEEIIGAVLRTRSKVRPVYVSTGHRVSLASAIDIVLQCGGGYRLPEPTRWAHRLASNPEVPA